LDFFARGAMTKPFEEAAFALKKGDISEVVESDFGYHIIRLTDIKVKGFDELRPQIEADLRKQQAQRKFAEAAETFSNGVYEQADGLKPVAEKLKLEVRTANGLLRAPAAGVTGVLANPKFLNAVFSDESVQRKHNTEAIEVGPSQLASAHVLRYVAAHTLPLAEVKASVRERVLATRGAEMARKEGAEKLQAWKADPSAAKLADAVTVSRDQGQKLPRTVVDAALRADSSSLPAWVGVDLGSQGYAVVKVNKLVARETPDAQRAQGERAQYGKWIGEAEGQAYYQMLKERFKVQIKTTKPSQNSADTQQGLKE
jgi:peptidyl-prolyl cis-trans isomerase D